MPISLNGAAKGSARTQFAALCWRRKQGKLQVLLVTSRRRKRWILPKGWPMDGKTPAECALIEAWEEAGVVGKASNDCIGVYSYERLREGEEVLPCLALLYPVAVKKLKRKYPERRDRRRRWVSPKKAAKLVDHRELGKLITGFKPPKKVPIS
ncbi:MAG: NUDIX hydrolase [Sulfitobacter sp.]